MYLKSFEQVYGEEGGTLYCPALMLKVWLYALLEVLSLLVG
jgi:transposase